MKGLQSLKLVALDRGISTHFPVSHLISSTCFETVNGQLGSVIQVQGIPFDTASADTLNSYSELWHQALCQLGDQFCVYVHTIRQRNQFEITGCFQQSFLADVNQRYRAQFSEQQLYENQLFITLLYKGFDSGKLGKSWHLFQQLSQKTSIIARARYRAEAEGKLSKAVNQMLACLQSFSPHLLGSGLHDQSLLRFFSRFINVGQDSKLSMQSFPPKFARADIHSQFPPGQLGAYLAAKRIFFGKAIEIQSETEGSRFARMLSIKTYPNETQCILLDSLLQLDAEFVTTHSFMIEPQSVALDRLNKQFIRLGNANDPAKTQLQQLHQCSDEVAGGQIQLGFHHHSIMVIVDSMDALNDACHQASKQLSAAGIVSVEETLGQEPAFWAQIPGNQRYIVRPSLITSRNFVDFCPLHNYPTGYKSKNHLGGPVTILETPSRTPAYFHFHTKGSGRQDDLTPGHTTIIGGNGSGKTVFMGFMDAQITRFGGRSFFFDRDRGMEIYVKAAGGCYVRIRAEDKQNGVKLNPFSLPDAPGNRNFLKQWLRQLVRLPDEEEVPAEIDQALSACVDYAYEQLPESDRFLSQAVKLLPIQFPRWHRLRKFLQAHDIYPAGEWAYLFDQPKDTLNVNISKLGFDCTDLLQQPQSIVTAVTMYLMHRVQNSLDGQRVSLYFDEGWQFLDDPYWKQYLKKSLPTLRKMNAHMVLATQSPESILSSALSAQFLDNSATQIFFCNPRADYDRHYRYFNITPSEFEFLKETSSAKRLFLYKQNHHSMICRLNLSGLPDLLRVFSANADSVRQVDALMAQFGSAPDTWLPIFLQSFEQKKAS